MPLPRGGEVDRRSGSGGGGGGGGDGDGDEEAWRRWAVLVATVWIQAVTGTNLDFSAYSSALKSSLGISQGALNYLATASDLGKALGWSSGLALLYMPLHGVLLVSAALGLAAYAVQYCCLVFLNPSSLAVRYPLVFLVCLVAGCSICWFNTVCFVLCIRSFSASNRPLALSLSISFNGLSAAFYTLFANAFSPTSPSVYLLLNAILPLAASILALPAILLCHTHDNHLQSVPRYDRRVFLSLYILAFITGIYLVVFGSLNTTRSAAAWVILTGAMVLLALPLIIPACSSCSYVDTHSIDSASHNDDPHKPLLVGNHLQNGSNAVMEKAMEQQLQGSSCGTILDKGRLVVLGEEHSAKRLIGCVDFWLYYTAYFCGATVGLVYSNNLGQIAQSLHQQSQLTMLLAVYSSFSFFGRLLSALPDFLHRKVSLARTGWLAAALVPMPMAFFLMRKQQDGSTLAVGTALIGLSSGFIFAAAVSVTSELFGPNSIGVNHNILITNIPLGSLLYGQIAALVYDANGQRMRVMDNHTGMIDTMIVCMGVKCYSTTFFVWGCITLLGLASSIVLFIRTKPVYASTASRSSCEHLHQVSRLDAEQRGNEGSDRRTEAGMDHEELHGGAYGGPDRRDLQPVVTDVFEEEAPRGPETQREDDEEAEAGSLRGALGWLRLDGVAADIISIAVPAVLALAADPITALVDTAFVGHIGSAELAAVGASASVFNLVSKLFNVPLLNVTTSFVAEQQAVDANSSSTTGQRDEFLTPQKKASQQKKVLPAVSTSLALAAGIGLLEMVALIVGSGTLMNIIGIPVDSPMRAPAEQFLTLRAYGAPPIIVALAAQGAFRGFLDTKTPLYAVGAGNLLNAILDAVLIFPLGLGVSGAALATVSSEYLTAFILLWKLNNEVDLFSWNIIGDGVIRYLKSGGLLIGRTIAVLLTLTLSTSLAAREGPVPMAGYEICLQVWLTISLLNDALALAGQALLASEYARGNYKQARMVVYRILQVGGVTGVVLAATLFVGFGSLSLLFTDDPAVLDVAQSGVWFVTISQPVNAIAFVADGLYYGVSDFAYAAYSTFFAGAVSSVFVLIAAPNFGLGGIWAGLTLFMSLRAIAGFWRLGSKGGPWEIIWSESE
ncbi:uncharacterized protein [Setaria viridis]|uniref:uncharacterized protein n=1 Tax=Setaria viridis TaxID=4556 RepID=UPI00149377EB|nr:uncharacterized protein LOC117833200 [Setaria viridis]